VKGSHQHSSSPSSITFRPEVANNAPDLLKAPSRPRWSACAVRFLQAGQGDVTQLPARGSNPGLPTNAGWAPGRAERAWTFRLVSGDSELCKPRQIDHQGMRCKLQIGGAKWLTTDKSATCWGANMAGCVPAFDV